MNKLVSKKRSTQLARQPSSPRANRVDGLLVMHLGTGHVSPGQEDDGYEPRTRPGEMYALVPAHARQHMDLRGKVCLCLLSLDKVRKLFLCVWLPPQQ